MCKDKVSMTHFRLKPGKLSCYYGILAIRCRRGKLMNAHGSKKEAEGHVRKGSICSLGKKTGVRKEYNFDYYLFHRFPSRKVV